MKAYWQGTLACDFLTFPIKLYTAVMPKEPRFHYLHAQCRTPLEYLRHCPHCGTDVSGDDIVRAYEYEDELVVVNDQELAALTPKPEPVLTLRQCVHAFAIDPVSFDRAFYVAPGTGAKKAYAVLHEALRQSGMVVLGTVTLREHDRHVLLRPAADGVLVLHTLFAAQDLLDLVTLPLPQHPASVIEVHAVLEGIRRLSGTYVPTQWTDRSEAALSALIARKARNTANRIPRVTGRTRRTSPPSSPKAAA
jgi:DNA end-binding protein Ku